jgi:hypothetical protein
MLLADPEYRGDGQGPGAARALRRVRVAMLRDLYPHDYALMRGGAFESERLLDAEARYGHAAWDWASDAQLLPDGAVQLPFGRVEAAGRDGRHPLPAPGPVRVLLRPDDVIHDDASPHTARVLRKAFRGAQILYTLELDGGVTALSLVPSHHDHAIGARIGICIAADHVVAFPSVRHE